MPATVAPALKPVGPHPRWVAAQRLAAGATPERAAVQARMELEQLEELQREPAFQRLLAEEVRELALPDAEWLKSVRIEVRQAAERALADGRVSTLNWFLRASLDLPALTAAGRPATQAALAIRAYNDEDDPPDDEEPDPDAWLAEVPVVESDPSDESLRRSLLGMIEHEGLRAQMAQGPLKSVEQLIVASDPVAYEEWFAKQPKPPFPPMTGLPDSIKADIEEVTRHNPPWRRGQYLSYYRPPVPAHLFEAGYAEDRDLAAQPPAIEPPAPADTIPSLRTRLARLLDRDAPRLPEELDLAEAVCAVRWPKWPEYRGPIDLGLLRRALIGTQIDARTLNWLGGREIVRECRVAGDRLAQGP